VTTTPYHDVPVLVLGASGFIGRWVARALTAQGARLTCAVRDAAGAKSVLAGYGVQGDLAAVDLASPAAVRALCERVRPAVTFNLAGYGVDRGEVDQQVATRINTDLVGELAELTQASAAPDWSGLRLVHVGSALEYGSIGGDLDERSAPNPTTLYGRTKLAGTRLLDGHAGAVAARLFTVYGSGEHEGRLLPSLLAAARTGERLPLSAGTQRRDFTFVEDVAEGLLRLGAATTSGVVNLATGRLAPVREFVETAARVLGISADRLSFGALPTRPEEMAHEPVTVARLRAATGWVPATTVAAGIERTSRFLEARSA